MQIHEALDLLSSQETVSTEALSEATRILQFSDDVSTLQTLASIAFDPSQNVTRRESSLVILRSRLLGWSSSSDETLRAFIEEGLVSCLLSSNNAQVHWRVASVISAILCSQEDAWPRLSTSVQQFLMGEMQEQEKLLVALSLLKAIFTDGPPRHLADLPKEAETLMTQNLLSANTDIQTLAIQAILVTLEHYATRPSIPQGCGRLLLALLRFACPGGGNIEGYNSSILESLGNMVNISSYITETRSSKSSLWTPESMAFMSQILDATNNTQTPSNIRQHVSQLAVSCYCTFPMKSTPFLQQVWAYLIAMLASPVPSPTMSPEDVRDCIVTWQLKRDDEESSLNDYELPDGSIDLSLVAWGQLDKLIMALGKEDAQQLVTKTATALLEQQLQGLESYCQYFAAWMVLSIFVGCKGTLIEKELLNSLLTAWKNAMSTVKAEQPDLIIQHAVSRIRWACLMFINEVLMQFENISISDQDVLSTLMLLAAQITGEPAPRVKAKLLVAYCQVVGNLEGTDLEPIFDSILREVLLPLSKQPCVLGAFPEQYATEFFACSMCLKELVLGAIAITVPKLKRQLLSTYYPTLMTDCMTLLEQVPNRATGAKEAEHVCEAVLDVARRLVEAAVTEDNDDADDDKQAAGRGDTDTHTNKSLLVSLTDRAQEDALTILRKILELDSYLLKSEPGASDRIVKSGIYASSFERTLLQVAASIVSVLEPPTMIPEFRQLLSIVQRKLQANDTIKVQDKLNLGHALNRAEIRKNDVTTTVVVQQGQGLQKTIDINTGLLEEQVASLAFIGATADKTFACLTKEETEAMIRLIEGVCRSSPIGMVRKAAIDALSELCKVLIDKFDTKATSMEGLRDGFDVWRDNEMRELFIDYLEKLARFLRVAMECLCTGGDNVKDNEILYAMSDMCEGLRNAYNYTNASFTEWPSPLLQEFKVQTLYGDLIEPLFVRMAASIKDAMTAVDEDDDDDGHGGAQDDREGHNGKGEDVFGVRCDAAMQVLSRLIKVFSKWVLTPFDLHLKVYYATILAMEDVSVVARTSALCVFANYVEASGVGAESTLPVACLYCRSMEIPPAAAQLIRAKLPYQITKVAERPNNDIETEEGYLLPIAQELQRALGDSMTSNAEDFISNFENSLSTEVMRIQAACYCVGVCSMVGGTELQQYLQQIDDAFASLLDHPLAGLGNRRVILDCLGCATMRIFVKLDPAQVAVSQMKIFSYSGLLKVLEYCFPLWADFEDACVSHDIIISWVHQDVLGGLPSLKASPVLHEQVVRILTSLRDEEDAELTLSFQAKHCNRLNSALSLLGVPLN